MKHVIGILFVAALIGCNHSPLKTGGARDASIGPVTPAPTAPATSTQTASATATQAIPATATPSVTNTSTATTTEPTTVTTVITATTTATATATGTVSVPKKLGIRVKRASDTPAARNIAAGSSDNDVTYLVFDADEPINVQQIPFVVVGNNHSDIISLRVYDDSGTLFCSGAIDNNGTLGCRNDFGLFVISGPTKLKLKVTVEHIGQGTPAAKPGDWFFAGIHVDDDVAYREFRAFGVNTGTLYGTGDMAQALPDPAIVLGGEVMTLQGCSIGITADIGNGINPRMAGSDSGFGIVWKDNTHMPKEMDKVMFAAVDIGGNKWSSDRDITTASDLSGFNVAVTSTDGGYVSNVKTGLYSNFSRFDADGKMIDTSLNQTTVDMIAGTNNAYGFMSVNMAPTLTKFNLSASGLAVDTQFQWGPSQRSGFSTTAAVQGNGSWAFGMAQDGKVSINVVKNGGVYPNLVNAKGNMAGLSATLEGIVLDSIAATDIGYVMAWWYVAPGQNWIHYLSFVSFDASPDGIVKQTIEVMGLTGTNSGGRHDRLAWNGKYIGLLIANPVVGDTYLLMFGSNGVQVGDVVNIFTDDSSRRKYDAADLAASGSTFGIASTSSAGDRAQFTPVICN